MPFLLKLLRFYRIEDFVSLTHLNLEQDYSLYLLVLVDVLVWKKQYHSFVGEGACGRWEIFQYKKFLWGSHFYWLCDCKAIKEILEYNSNIVMVARWV